MRTPRFDHGENIMSETTLAKIAITPSSDNDLCRALDRINQDFEGGRVTKTDLASWLIQKAAGTLDEPAIEEIRRAHFNQVVYLETLVKKLKASGRDNLGTEEKATLQAMLGQQTTKKRLRPTNSMGKEPINAEEGGK